MWLAGQGDGWGAILRSSLILIRIVLAVAIAAMLSACASSDVGMPRPEFLASPAQEAAEPAEISDPFEKQNRAVFEGGQEFNHAVIYPLAKAYNQGVPEELRDRIAAFATNLGEPIVFANNVLQLRFEAAATTLGRFALNSTVGIGGLFDVAATQEMPHQSGDFGQTLYVWGVRDSPYLYLPVLGPTNVRDAIGSGIEFAAQIPVGGLYPTRFAATAQNISAAGTVLTPLSDLSKVEQMETLEQTSLDFYTMLRSVADQKRQAELREALETSALTAALVPADPNAIEPVMVLTASPAWAEKPAMLAESKLEPASDLPPTRIIVGTPAIVGESAAR
jgi:phospholipid-binding lipoprotein MlaA